MARKHNVPKNRSRSRYAERLAARGLVGSPRMPFITPDGRQHDDVAALYRHTPADH